MFHWNEYCIWFWRSGFKVWLSIWGCINCRSEIMIWTWHLPSVGWWFQMVFYFHPYLRKRSKMTSIIFQIGWKHQLDQTSSESFNFYRQSHRYLPGASIIPVLLQPMSRLKACVPCQPDVCVVIGLGHCVQWVCLTFSIAWITGRNILENITNPWIKAIYYWVVVSKICYFHPYLGKIPKLTSIFFKGVETTN